MTRDVVVSNGFGRFHLAVAAAELDQRQRLALLLTGAYPSAKLKRALGLLGLSRGKKVARLLDREEEVAPSRLRGLAVAEMVHQTALLLSRVPLSGPFARMVDRLSWRLYGLVAVPALRRLDRDIRIFHYRAGFGGLSAEAARRRGCVLLCDHSIAHPAVLERLIELNGAFPASGSRPISKLWRQALVDIERADAVLVNSDFVRQTFLHAGWSSEDVHVLYWGLDDRFLRALPERRAPSRVLRLMFAGALERRKGAHTLLEALRHLEDIDWTIELAGSIDPDIATQFGDVLADPRVRALGVLPRPELPARLTAADVFVFPSLAEGSARVVFEALAAGCYVITTPNAGSIVQDGVHGRLVPPGDARVLAAAIRESSAERRRVAAIGADNARVVRERYTQGQYGDGLERVYQRLRSAAEAVEQEHELVVTL